jgi:hypothetical protein
METSNNTSTNIYDPSSFLKLINNEFNKLYNTNNVNKTYSLNNIYIYKKYKSINYILYVILFVTIIILILTFLNKNFKYFDDYAYSIIVAVIIGSTTVYIITKILDILLRNNINYDEYEFKKPNKLYVYKNIIYTDNKSETIENKCNKPL